jgi:hypothetical protein
MESDRPIDASSLIGKVYRKRDASREERIRFVTATEFWHRFLDEDSEWSPPHPYRVRSDGCFELDWCNGDVFLCEFHGSSSQFTEINPRDIAEWELDTDQDYSDKGSTSS